MPRRDSSSSWSARTKPRNWTCDRLIAIYLAGWEPLNLAVFVAPVLPTIGARGYATAAFLVFRVLVAASGVAAGLALWRGAPHARGIAVAVLALSATAGIITLTTTLLPTNIVPGDEWLWIGLVALFNGSAAGCLLRASVRSSPRVRWRR